MIYNFRKQFLNYYQIWVPNDLIESGVVEPSWSWLWLLKVNAQCLGWFSESWSCSLDRVQPCRHVLVNLTLTSFQNQKCQEPEPSLALEMCPKTLKNNYSFNTKSIHVHYRKTRKHTERNTRNVSYITHLKNHFLISWWVSNLISVSLIQNKYLTAHII
jgi:hypothetical protein